MPNWSSSSAGREPLSGPWTSRTASISETPISVTPSQPQAAHRSERFAKSFSSAPFPRTYRSAPRPRGTSSSMERSPSKSAAPTKTPPKSGDWRTLSSLSTIYPWAAVKGSHSGSSAFSGRKMHFTTRSFVAGGTETRRESAETARRERRPYSVTPQVSGLSSQVSALIPPSHGLRSPPSTTLEAKRRPSVARRAKDGHYSTTPLLHHSITPSPLLPLPASVVFCLKYSINFG